VLLGPRPEKVYKFKKIVYTASMKRIRNYEGSENAAKNTLPQFSFFDFTNWDKGVALIFENGI
jgi:hypothetical protein